MVPLIDSDDSNQIFFSLLVNPPAAVAHPLAGGEGNQDEVRPAGVAHVDGHGARLVPAAVAVAVPVDLQAAVLDLGQGGRGVRAGLL